MIDNMKNDILKQYANLLKERNETKLRIEHIDAKLERLNDEGNVADAVKGGMGNNQTFHIEGFPTAEEDELRAQLRKQRRELDYREHAISDKVTDVEAWLNTLTDSRMRRMITKRYIEEKSWQQVAIEMGKHYTAESCRKQIDRFIKEFDKK